MGHIPRVPLSDATDTLKNRIHLHQQDAHHLRRVLRIRRGDELKLFRADGREFHAKVTNVEPLEVDILREYQLRTELGIDIVVHPPVLRNSKMSVIVEKATELGAARIRPVLTQYCDGHAIRAAEKHMDRWSRIAREAVKQCGRYRTPDVQPPTQLSEIITEPSPAPILVCTPAGDGQETVPMSRYRDAMENEAEIHVVVGPEGGFSSEERDLFARSGSKQLSRMDLGRRILRVETAVFAALGVLQLLAEDLFEPRR